MDKKAKATIFFLTDAKNSKKDVCFGVRFDEQQLPEGSVVVGSMGNEDFSSGVSYNVEAPEMEPNQVDSWNLTLQKAELILLLGEARADFISDKVL